MSKSAQEASEQYSSENTGAIMLSHYETLVNQTEARRHGLGYSLRKTWENLFAK